MKRAFTERALRYHPDRQDPDDPGARERAEWRMREINQAWAVLRSPADRAAYDATLGMKTAYSAAADGAFVPRSAHPAGRNWFVEPEVADIEPLDPGEARPSERRRRRPVSVGPLVVGGVVLMTALVALGVATAQHQDTTTIQTRERYGKGTCVAEVGMVPQPGDEVDHPEKAVIEVPCTAPHTGRVVDKVDFPRPCPSGTVALPMLDQNISLCLVP